LQRRIQQVRGRQRRERPEFAIPRRFPENIHITYIQELAVTEAAIFMSGNSQAVRLPKSFRFNGKSVEIFRRGDEVVLREKRQTLAQVLKDLPPLSPEESEALDRAMAEIDRDQPPQERDWDQLLGADPKP